MPTALDATARDVWVVHEPVRQRSRFRSEDEECLLERRHGLGDRFGRHCLALGRELRSRLERPSHELLLGAPRRVTGHRSGVGVSARAPRLCTLEAFLAPVAVRRRPNDVEGTREPLARVCVRDISGDDEVRQSGRQRLHVGFDPVREPQLIPQSVAECVREHVERDRGGCRTVGDEREAESGVPSRGIERRRRQIGERLRLGRRGISRAFGKSKLDISRLHPGEPQRHVPACEVGCGPGEDSMFLEPQ